MSSQEPVDLLSVGQNRRVYDCFNDRLEVEPYADISGIGAHVGYLGTAYLVIVILSGYYFLAFDPLRSPFTESEIPLHLEEESAGVEAEKRGIKRQWEPNPIDVACVGFCRRVFAKPARPSIHEQPSSQLEDAFHSSVLTLCDVQIATGTGILVSAYASLNGEEGISVYHWMIVIYLAWFANLTHLTGLTLLRPHLYRYSGERNWRMVFIVSLFVLLLVAQVPTIYFGAARYPAYARCFFDVRTVMKRMQLHDPYGHQYELVSAPAIVSMVLLALGFLTRIVKGSSRLSRNLGRLRRWASDIAQLSIHRIAGVSSSSEMFRTRPRLQQLWAVLVVRPLVAVFLTWRLYMDLCSSLLSEIFWLWIAVLWGTAHIIQLRRFSYLEVSDESRLTFGQIHPILLLVLPMIPVIVKLGTSVPELWQSDDDTDGISDLDITSECAEEGDTPSRPNANPPGILDYLSRHHGEVDNEKIAHNVLPSLLYTSPWSIPTMWLAKGQAIFFTIAIFGELFYSLKLSNILASLIAWIIFMQSSACYIVILLGLSSGGRPSTQSWSRVPKRLSRLLSTDGTLLWWLVAALVFTGYSLSPIWTSGRYSSEHEHSPVLQTLYRDHTAVPAAVVFHGLYSVFAGVRAILPGNNQTVEAVKETQERQALD